ncbi:MAG: hypothetical protein AB1761_08310 [Pseudomonadota bacterium]
MRTRFERVKHPHLAVVRDQVGRVQLFPLASAGAAVARFERFRQVLAALELMPVGSPAMPLACLLGFEIVCELNSLPAAYAAARTMRHWRGRPFLDWQDGGRPLCRRFVSPLTAIAIAAQPNLPTLPAAMLALRDALATNGLCGAHVDPAGCISALQADAGAWAAHHLPGYLASHLLGLTPLACVPRSALAREESLLALTSGNADTPEPEPGDPSTGAAIAPLAARKASDLRRALRDVLAVEQGVSEHAQRRRVLTRLEGLRRSATIRDLALRLVLDFAFELVAKGTPQTEPLALVTAADYLAHVIDGLLTELPAVLDHPTDGDAWTDAYRKIADGVHPGARHKASAALSAFHAFAVQVIDAPTLRGPAVHGVAVEPPPRANVVWPHEIDWIRGQLEQRDGDRLIQQVRAVLELLSTTGARIGDAWSLLMQGVRDAEPHRLDVAFDPLPSTDRHKTPAAVRELSVRDRVAVQTLLAWHRRRVREGAQPRDLLFGDPHAPRRIWREGETVALLSALLKAATGDRDISIHTLRHSRVTFEFMEFGDGVDADRRAERISAAIGHQSSATTHYHYDHGHDLALRTRLDNLERRIDLPERAASSWLGVRAGTLRKRWSRARVAAIDWIWNALADRGQRLPMLSVVSDYALGIPAPVDLGLAERRATVADVLRVLCDTLAGHSVASIALRTDLPEPIVRRVLRSALSLAGRATVDAELDGCLDLLLSAALKSARPYVDLTATSQRKLRPLLAYLAARTAAQQPGEPDLQAVCAAWRGCLAGRYVSLESQRAAFVLLRFLAAAGIGARSIVVRLASSAGEDDTHLADQLRERCFAALGAMPRIERCAPRRGRPRAYLLLGADRDSPAAAREVGGGGLHAVMWCLEVWLAVHARNVP